MSDSSLQSRSRRFGQRVGFGFARRLAGVVALCTLLGIVVAGCNKTDVSKGQPTLQLVVIEPITNYQVTDFQDFTGRLDGYRNVDIRARVSGFIVKAPFREGDVVHEGDLLFEVDPRPYQADYNQAEADLKVAITDAALQEKNAERAKKSFPRGGISKEDFDTALATEAKAVATVGLKEAARDKAKLYLDYTRVTAPFTGRVSRRQVDPGNLATADTTLLTSIVTINPVYAYFDVDERTYLELQKRSTKRVLMRLANEDKYAHIGDLDFVDNRVNANAGTMRMRGVFDAFQGGDGVVAAIGDAPNILTRLPTILSAGLFCRVRVPVGDPYYAILIPDAAVQTDQGRKFVFVVTPKIDKDGKPVYRLDKDGNPVYKKAKTKDGGEEIVKDKDGNPIPVPEWRVEYRQVETGQQVGEFRVIKNDPKTNEPPIRKGELVVTKGQQRVRLNGSEPTVEIKMDDTKYLKPDNPLNAMAPGEKVEKPAAPPGGLKPPKKDG
jgi:membrane fusion protein, multidrug efflux system